MAVSLPEPEHVTPEWLTHALTRSGVIGKGAEVVGVSVTPVGDGLSARSFRFMLEWSRPDEAVPRSLVGKFASAEARGLATARATGSYRRELRFYQELAPTSAVRCPRAFVAELDPESGRFVLLLEDLSQSQAGDQVSGCSVDEARLAMTEAAKLHAAHWGDVTLRERRYLIRHEPAGWASSALRKHWPQFLEAYGDQLPAGSADIGRRLVDGYDEYLAANTGPECVVHYDYRLDNMLFGSDPDAPPIAIVDWQTVGVAPGTADIAYFLGTAFKQQRGDHELGLLAAYHDGLVAAGVENYDFAHCQDDYRRQALGAAALTVVACVAIPATDGRGHAMFTAMAERQFTQVIELGADEFLAR